MYGGAVAKLVIPRACSHELLEPSATRREKSFDVSHDRFMSLKNFVET